MLCDEIHAAIRGLDLLPLAICNVPLGRRNPA